MSEGQTSLTPGASELNSRRDRELRDLLGERDKDFGMQVFHISLGKPEDVRIVAIRMGKVARVVHLADQYVWCRKSAGRIDVIVRIMSDLDFGIILRFQILPGGWSSIRILST